MSRPSHLAALAAALLAGLGHAASLADPWVGQPRWGLQVACLAVLAGLLQRCASPRAAALLGWVFAVSWLAGTFWWLFISMHVYGGLASPLAALAVLLLASFLALYYAAGAAVYAWLGARQARVPRALVFAAVWLPAELMRAGWFTGFPWGAAGYAHVDGPLAALAPWIGVYGIGALAAAIAHVLAQAVAPSDPGSPRHWVAPAVAVAVLLVAPLAPSMGGPATPRLSVSLLQGNIPQDEKFEKGTGVPFALRWYAEQLRDAKTALVVSPETSIPKLPAQLPDGYMDALRKRFSQAPQAALLGLPLGSYREGYTNSALGLKPGAEPYRYDKHHLVPFGEFIPPFFRWFTNLMDIPLGDFHRGAVGQPSFEWQGQRLAPNICYEDMFGEELAQRFGDAAQAPTIFVNISNIAWFGNTVAIDQHLHISRMRALEFQRPMLRATNTGATAIIDRAGRVTHALPRHTRGVLVGEVEGATGVTPYAWWVARAGLWPLWLAALAVVLLGWHAARSDPRGAPAPAQPDARPS